MAFTSFLLALLLTLTFTSCLYAQPPCPPGQILQNEKCVECPVGTYGTNENICLSCGPGTSQPHTGAVAIDLCRFCTPGTYSDQPASPTCKPCPKGTISRFGATKCSKCGPGTAAVFLGTGCDQCSRGSYSTGVANLECESCPGLLTSKPGSKSRKACKPCQPDRKPNFCPVCGSKWFYSVERDECLSCPPGTFTRVDDATSEDQCIPCPRNTFISRSSEKCRPCKPGTFTKGTGNTVCRRKGERCFPDFFENKNGDCQRCGPGWIFVKGEKRCERCPAGHVSKGSKQTKCTKCVGGMRPGFLNIICKCGPGTFYVNKRVCLPCPAGSDMVNDAHTNRECFKCDKGTFKKRRGTHKCERCPFGMVALEEGSRRCTKCPAGTMPDLELNTADYLHGSAQCMSTKTRCPLGYRRRTVGVSETFISCEQVACRVGTPKEEINKTCSPCKAGYKLVGDGTQCGECGIREVSDGGIITKCKKCKNGLFQDDVDGSKCTCLGFNALGYGIQNGKCKKCPGGTFGGYTSEKCLKCEAGTFAKGIGNDECKGCPVGSVSGKGASSCGKCPKGKIPNKRHRATKCVRDT